MTRRQPECCAFCARRIGRFGWTRALLDGRLVLAHKVCALARITATTT